MRVAIYCRFSSEMQSSRSAVDQERECRSYAESQGWKVVLAERDEAVRAGATASRAGYSRLIEEASRRTFDVLLVEETSRFSRDFLGGISELAKLAAFGVKLADPRSGVLDLDNIDGQLRLSIGLATSQQETKRLGERSKRGLKGKTLERFSSGGRPPFGLQRVPLFSDHLVDVDGRPKRIGVRFEPDPNEAAIVLRIFRLYRDGASKHELARRLNEEGRSTRRAGGTTLGRKNRGAWTAAGIKYLLENHIYVGERVWNRSSRRGTKLEVSGKKRQVDNPANEWVTVEDFVTPIVERELWDGVQARLALDRDKYAREHVVSKPSRYLLSGMIRCASCGANYIIGAHQGRPRVPHYRCGARSSAGAVVCSNRVTVSAPALEKRVTEMLDVVVKSPKQLEALVAEHNKKISSANEVQLASVRALEIRKRDLEAQKERLLDAIKQGTGAVSILVGELDKCAQELDGIAKRIESLRVLVQPLLIPRRHAVTDYISGSASLFTGDVTEDRATLEKVLEGVWVYADGSLLVQFRRESLFHPVRHVHLLPVSKTVQDDVATARGELLKGFQEAIGTYRAGAANDLKDDIEVDIFEDADGPPAVAAMTRGSTKSTFGDGAAGPSREITRKIAFASPAGFEPALAA